MSVLPSTAFLLWATKFQPTVAARAALPTLLLPVELGLHAWDNWSIVHACGSTLCLCGSSCCS